MTQADLLCYLVASQLTARARTGRWLATERLVSATRAWLACHRVDCEWYDRVRIAIASMRLAHEIHDAAAIDGGDEFAERIRIDRDGPRMKALRARCDVLLRRLDRR